MDRSKVKFAVVSGPLLIPPTYKLPVPNKLSRAGGTKAKIFAIEWRVDVSDHIR